MEPVIQSLIFVTLLPLILAGWTAVDIYIQKLAKKITDKAQGS